MFTLDSFVQFTTQSTFEQNNYEIVFKKKLKCIICDFLISSSALSWSCVSLLLMHQSFMFLRSLVFLLDTHQLVLIDQLVLVWFIATPFVISKWLDNPFAVRIWLDLLCFASLCRNLIHIIVVWTKECMQLVCLLNLFVITT